MKKNPQGTENAKGSTGRLNLKLHRNTSAHSFSVYSLKKLISFLKIFSVTVSGKMLTTAPVEVNKGDNYHKQYISKEQLHLGWSEKPKDILI